MTAAQTTYPISMVVSNAGQLVDLHDNDISSKSVESASIGFGLAVSRGTNSDRQAVLGGTSFLGITVRDLAREGANSGTLQYLANETAAVLTKGYIWVVCPGGCVPGQSVLYVDATGILDVSPVGVAGPGETLLNDAQWETTAAAGELAILRLDTFQTTTGA